MKKYLSVVFVIYIEKVENKNKFYILMGKQAPGKKLAGFRNGYGGKCEYLEKENRLETTLECAERELEEELGLNKGYKISLENLKDNNFQKIGYVLMDEKQIDFFVLKLEEKIKEPENNGEFIDTKWFELNFQKVNNNFLEDIFVKEMLSGDDVLIEKLKEFLESKYLNKSNLKDLEEFKEFIIDKTGDKLLQTQVQNIYK